MSVRVMAIVWEHFPQGGSALLTMLALADFGNDQGGSIHPSVPTLGKKIRHNDRYTRKILRSLESEGWIETVSLSAGGPQISTRRYRINVEKLNDTPVPQDPPVLQDTPVLEGTYPCPTGPEPLSPRTPDPLLTVNNHQEARSETSFQTRCPYLKILDVYHEVLPELPTVRKLTDKRKRQLKARWKESTEQQDLAWWRRYFEYVRKSDFLMGQKDGSNGRPPFLANLEWLTTASNSVKIIEGQYHR